MGRLINGTWFTDEDTQGASTDGKYQREPTVFHGTLTEVPAGRFHLWVAHNCSWSQRLIIARNLLGNRDHITQTVAHFRRDDEGWWFPEGADGFEPNADGRLHLWKIYVGADAHYTGRATVPALWDRTEKTIIGNESSELLRQLDSFGVSDVQLVPEHLREQIDELNSWIYPQLNNGTYKAGFARTQAAYEEAAHQVFAALDRIEGILANQRYLAGDVLTEADIRLFPTLVRFDSVYYGHFRCNLRKIVDYPNLWAYTRDLYATPGIGETVQVEIYKQGYYGNSMSLNPRRYVPLGPIIDWQAPHDRGSAPAFASRT